MGHIRFVFGRSGGGKSTHIASLIRQATEGNALGPKLFWIVPSELSYTTERMLLNQVKTTVRAEVVHLHRLAERAYRDMALGPIIPVNQTGKRMLLADVFRSFTSQLQVLSKDVPSVAFLDAVLAVFDEMSANDVSLHQIETALETAATNLLQWEDEYASFTGLSLLGKLRDLCVLYVRWQQQLHQREMYNPADIYAVVRPHLHGWDELSGSQLFIDGYTEFTASELQFVLSMAECAEETVISLCGDETWLTVPAAFLQSGLRLVDGRTDVGELPLISSLGQSTNPDEVFAPQVLHSFHRLLKGASERGIPMLPPTVLHGESLVAAEGIRALDPSLQRRGQGNVLVGKGVTIAAAQNIRVETYGVAREIVRIHEECSVPYEDIVVLVPHVDTYAPYVRDAFIRFAIPYYVDEFPPLSSHPLARFILAVVQCVDEGFSQDAVLRLVKAEFSGIAFEDADWLELYIREYEVSGWKTWLQDKPWTFAWDDRANAATDSGARARDSRAERCRQVLLQFLRPFSQAVAGDDLTASAFAESIWSLLQAVGAKEVVAEWMVNEEGDRSPTEASLQEQAWQHVVGMLNDLWSVAPETPHGKKFLFQLVRNHLLGQSLTGIPAGLGQTLVTDYQRANGLHARTVFIMGATDEVLPRRWRSHGLIADEERVQFYRLFGQPLGYTAEERQLAERFTEYSLLTSAWERLYLTYPLSDKNGKELRPSSLLAHVRGKFQRGVEQDLLWTAIGLNADAVRTWLSPEAALSALVDSLRPSHDVHPKLATFEQKLIYDWWSERPDGDARIRKALAGVLHDAEASPLSTEIAKALYGTPIAVNAYQLEAFAACPYQHFVNYGLRLEEERTPDITSAVRGTVIHDALNVFMQMQGERLELWRTGTEDDAIVVMRQAFEEVLSAPKGSRWDRNALRKYLSYEVWSVLERAAVVLTRHAREGQFETVATEVAFGTGDSNGLPPLEFPLGDGTTALLRGRVDRVDVVRTSDGNGFRIVDYKSSVLDIDLSDVHYGLRLQLPLYASVIEAYSTDILGGPAVPVGLVYLPIFRKTTLRDTPIDGRQAIEDGIKELRMRGFIVGREDVVEATDRRLATGGESELFKRVYKKDGSLTKNAPVLSADDWSAMLNYVKDKVQELARGIQAGIIDVAPIRFNAQNIACTNCQLQKICHLDIRYDSDRVRYAKKLTKDDVLEKWKDFRLPLSGGNA